MNNERTFLLSRIFLVNNNSINLIGSRLLCACVNSVKHVKIVHSITVLNEIS